MVVGGVVKMVVRNFLCRCGRRWARCVAAQQHTRTDMQDHHPPSIHHHPPSINDYFAHVMATACGCERWGRCVRK